MANKLSLDTANHPNLTQVLVNTPLGLFDFKVQQLTGSVTVTDPVVKAQLLAIKNPSNGKSFLAES